MTEGKKVTWFPSYGAEMRGGTANCTVIISDDMIGSPVVLNPDVLIAMNSASLEKFQHTIRKKGILFFDASFAQKTRFRKDIELIPVPATRIASLTGSTRSANMVMLGAFVARTSLIKTSSAIKIFENRSEFVKNSNGRTNINSILEGIKYIENKKSQDN